MKYRLKKEYPNSPKKGTIINHCYYEDSEHPCIEVENYPEFWEELRQSQRDYEILTVKTKGGDLWYNVGKGKVSTIKNQDPIFAPYTLSYFLSISIYKIHSVKRLSDEEVFTVGDKIKCTTHNDEGQIYDFKIKPEGIRVSLSKIYYHLSKIEHVKKPLFTTHDGVDIYEGDTVFFVMDDYRIVEYSAVYDKGADNMIPFSTSKKAEEWVEDNEPRYSKKDLREAAVGCWNAYGYVNWKLMQRNLEKTK